ncbi:MAG: hypothetical protein NXI08_09115 [bacterium]|nr:hypothetical protein [bacterium]
MANKTFNKSEIKEILSKAQKLQSSLEIDNQKDNLTVDELAEIASEIGISKSVLNQALQIQETPDLGSTFNWLTGTGVIQTTAFINRSISKGELEEKLAELNAIIGRKGRLEQVGTAVDWEINESEFIDLQRITFHPSSNETKITHRVSWNEVRYLGLGLAAFFGSIAFIVLGKSFGLAKSTFIMLSPLGALGGYSLCMIGLNNFYRKQKSRMKKISRAITSAFSKKNPNTITIDEELSTEHNSENLSIKKVKN